MNTTPRIPGNILDTDSYRSNMVLDPNEPAGKKHNDSNDTKKSWSDLWNNPSKSPPICHQVNCIARNTFQNLK